MMSAFFENIFEKHDGWVPSSVKVTGDGHLDPAPESVIWHVRLACRTKGDTTSSQQRLSSAIATARILALTDQFAARELLTMIDDKVNSIPRGDGGVSLYDQWHPAAEQT